MRHDFELVARGGTLSSTFRKVISLLCLGAAFGLQLVPPAEAQNCPGDCSRDRVVTVDELVSCLEIGLQAAPGDVCPACDSNTDGRVTVDEMIEAVAAALRLLVADATGTCVVPGPTGLVPCAEGTRVQVGRCDDRTACLRDSDEIVSVAAEPVGTNGSFTLMMNRCQVTGATLVFEAEVHRKTGTTYRTMSFGSIGSGFGLGSDGGALGVIDDVRIGPASEGAVRVLQENGLENFDDRAAVEIFTAAESTNAETDFSGLAPDEAAELAEETAAHDPLVQATVSQSRTLCLQQEFTLLLDNGRPGTVIGVNNVQTGGNEGSAFIWLNRHIVSDSDLPITIDALSNVWPDEANLSGGEQAQLLVYLDEDADGDPADAILVASQSIVLPAPSNEVRALHPLDDPVTLAIPGDVYVGFADVQSGTDRVVRFMALQDDSGGGERSFVIYNPNLPTVDVANLANNEVIQSVQFSLPGAWFVRAEGVCTDSGF